MGTDTEVIGDEDFARGDGLGETVRIGVEEETEET